MCELENLGKYHGVQHSQWFHSMADINILGYFFASWYHFRFYSHFKIRDLENVSQFRDLQHSRWSHSMINIWHPIWWRQLCLLCLLPFTRYSQIKMPQVWPWKWMTSSRAVAPFDCKYSILYRWFFQNFSYQTTNVYAKEYTYAYIQTQRERGIGVMAIGKICSRFV